MTGNPLTLHVTNGDAVLYVFKKAGIGGKHLAWRDSLHEGPVPPSLGLEDTSAIRTRYLAARGYGNQIKIVHDFQVRDALLRKAGEFREVVLWFEHDLYDQLQLLQTLTALDELGLEPGRVALVQSDHYLGMMSADELAPLLPRRRTATPAVFKSARRAWDRFTSPSPSELLAAAREDAIGLPFLRAALGRLCEEYPRCGDGLSRSQRHALEAVAAGRGSDEELFARAQAREEAAFLTDTAFARVLEDLRDARAPLIAGEAGAWEPTPLGQRVLSEDADWLAAAPIDRWIGGVHLVPSLNVRWDEAAGTFAG